MDDSTPADRESTEPPVAGADEEAEGASPSGESTPPVEAEDADLEALRVEVDEKYDFDDFRPSDMARMSPEEWDVSFDSDSWITGPELLDRVEAELKSRIASREVFAVLERVIEDGEELLLAYSDVGYAIVHADGTIEGRAAVLEDVKPTVALCSMPEYEPPDPPAEYELPEPEDVPDGSGEFGNQMIQIVAFLQTIAGVALLGAWILTDLSTLVAPVMALIFLAIGIFLFTTVANARLSNRFRSEEYRERLRGVRLVDDERPEFVPVEGQPIDRSGDRNRGAKGSSDRIAGADENAPTDANTDATNRD